MAPVTADTSVLMDELMAGTRRSNKKNHSSHSNSRESQVTIICRLKDILIYVVYLRH